MLTLEEKQLIFTKCLKCPTDRSSKDFLVKTNAASANCKSAVETLFMLNLVLNVCVKYRLQDKQTNGTKDRVIP